MNKRCEAEKSYFGIIQYIDIYLVRHKYQNTAYGYFNVGARRRTIVKTHSAAPKMPSAPSAFL